MACVVAVTTAAVVAAKESGLCNFSLIFVRR